MTRKIIVWDMDEVITNTRDPICNILAPSIGVKTCWQNWKNSQEIYKELGHTNPADSIRLLIEHRIIETCKPENNAYETLKAATELGYTNIIVTARGWHPNPYDVSWAWLKEHNLSQFIYKLVVVPVFGQKFRALESIRFNLGEICLFVEDTYNNLLDTLVLSSFKVKNYALMDRPWNQNVDVRNLPITRIHDLLEIKSLLV